MLSIVFRERWLLTRPLLPNHELDHAVHIIILVSFSWGSFLFAVTSPFSSLIFDSGQPAFVCMN